MSKELFKFSSKRSKIAKLLSSINMLSILLILLMTSINISSQQVGGTLVVALISEPTQIVATSSWNGGFIAAQVFDTLLRFDPNLNLVPGLAQSFEVNEKEGYYKFVLRDGVKFHDGKPLTPEDIKFTFEQIVSKYTSFGALYFANTTVTIIDSRTVIIKPGKFMPGAQLPLFAAVDTTPILPKHLLEGQDFLKSEFITTKPVGTGPYKLVSWVKGSYIELVRNSDYWDKPRPYLDRIIVRFISDPAALIAGLKKGEISYVFRGIPYEAVPDLQRTPGLKVFIHDRPPYVAALWINVKSSPLSDPKVREAIMYALNRTEIAEKATFRLAKPVDYMIDPAMVLPSPGIKKYAYDPSTAEKLLDEAGYRKGPDGKRFAIELLTRTGEPDEQIIAQLVRDQLSKVGIDVNIKSVDFATYLSLQTKFQYQIATVKYWISPLWTYQLFHSKWIGKGAFTNNFQYSNPEVDRLLDLWLAEPSISKQIEYLQKVEDILSRDLPLIVLYRVPWINVINEKFSGTDIPIGKWVFWDPLINTYMIQQITPQTTTMTPQITTTPAQYFQTPTTPAQQPMVTPTTALPQPGISAPVMAIITAILVIVIIYFIYRYLRRNS
jgi:peptide/nickel transport system substrate-binding protein